MDLGRERERERTGQGRVMMACKAHARDFKITGERRKKKKRGW